MSNIPSNLAAALGRPPASIPQCRFLVRKGEAPRSDRTNIFMWTPALALRINEFEAYHGELPALPVAGQSLSTVVPTAPALELPPAATTAPALELSPVVSTAPTAPTPDDTEVDSEETMRRVTIHMAFAELTPEELKGDGTPNTNAVRSRTGFGDLTAAEVQAEWFKFKELKTEE